MVRPARRFQPIVNDMSDGWTDRSFNGDESARLNIDIQVRFAPRLGATAYILGSCVGRDRIRHDETPRGAPGCLSNRPYIFPILVVPKKAGCTNFFLLGCSV